MNIWIFNHFASTPDQPMTGAYYLAQALARRGHRVCIFASSFSYYKRQELRLRGTSLSKTEQVGDIHFNWVRTSPHSGRLVSRLFNMLSYMLSAAYAGLRQRDKPDVVVGTCPHLFGAVSAMLVAWLLGSRFVYEVRDLWPQTFVDDGTLKDRAIVTRLLRWIEKQLYDRAALIVSVLPYVDEYLREVGVDASKFVWIPNGLDVSTAPPWTPPTRRRGEDAMTFMYVGGHARYQGLETVIYAARQLQREGETAAHIVLVGDGAQKPSLQRLVEQLGLNNVELRDSVPRSEVPNQLAKAAVAIYHIKPMSVLRFGVSPNKLCDYLISGRPVLCAGQLRNNPVADANAGICTDADDTEAMAAAMKQFLRMSPTELTEMGQRGRAYALANFDSRVLAERFETHLLDSLRQADSPTKLISIPRPL